ncbi:MAG: DUF2207 domain-containing protein [Candidatus Shapirobacteria bacterium]
MKRFFRLGILTFLFFIIFTTKAMALTIDADTEVLTGDYGIKNFETEINLNQDRSLNVKEKIDVNFFIERHGIFRIIPYIYKKNGKTINARINVLSVTDENGQRVPYFVDNYKQSRRIKIGDANLTVLGNKSYLIEYTIKNVVLDYGNGPEIYWNVTGSEWSAPIMKSSAIVTSPFGKITKTECFGCINNFSENKATFNGEGRLTIVAQIDKNNNLLIPSKWDGIWTKIWPYLIAIMPFLIMFLAWYKKGRDKRFLTDNVYYEPENKTEKDVPLLNRPHLPLVYSPIDGLSPAEMGTIIDEKVDTKDIVAEIVELARLGYLTIKKIEIKKIFGFDKSDYELVRTGKKGENLNKFQINLLESLFDSEKEGTIVKISDLKDHFYTHLEDLKADVYSDLVNKKMAANNFDKTKIKWKNIAIFLNIFAFFGIAIGLSQFSVDGNAFFVLIIGIIPTFILAKSMPRKTAWGYSLHRQAVGLKFYLSKGKWREEIAEKNLFLEEMLPLAISLGVVKQLAADMKDLGIEPPKYFQGVVMASFANDLNHFSSSTANGLISAPVKYSGSSSWSGGSGFSGGFSGGGFGGGGGGSW